MRLILTLPAPLRCAAWDGPSAEFPGLPARTVQVEGSTFVVRMAKDRAVAVRTNMEYAPNLAAVAPRAAVAMERASGCRVLPRTIEGNAAMIRAVLDCA